MPVRRHHELKFIRQVVRQIITAEVHGVRAGVIDFKPIFKLRIGGICERHEIIREPFVDGDGERRVGVRVRRPGVA